jgi:hypothetical protein
MRIESPSKRAFPYLWGGGAVILLIAGLLCFQFFRSYALTPFEVGNFIGEAQYSTDKGKKWHTLERGQVFDRGSIIRTGPNSEAVILVQGKIQMRLKENSVLGNKSGKKYNLHLAKGVLLGATPKDQNQEEFLKITTPVSVAAVRGTLFRIEHNAESQKTSVSVLQGNMSVRTKDRTTKESVNVGSLFVTEITAGQAPIAPVKMSRAQWLDVKETYELIQRDAEFEIRQKDLAKNAGNLFDYVFDHGTFYMPKFGFAMREFEVDDVSGGEVNLNVEYDVYPRGTFAGVYMKTRNFDLSNFSALTFDIRRMPGEGYPDGFRIEFKSGNQVVRAFAPRVIKPDWVKEELKLQASRETPVEEITFVFTHDKVGGHKKGALQLRNIHLVPVESPPQPSN